MNEKLRFRAVFSPSRWYLLQVLNFCYKILCNDFHIFPIYGIILLVFRGLLCEVVLNTVTEAGKMSGANQFDWVPFYKELADKLLQYKDNRPSLIDKVRQIYTVTGIGMPTLEQDDHIDDLDPFTLFGLFNKTSMKTANRIKIIKAIAQLFDVSAPVPSAFDSIPLLNPLNATFYPFRDNRPADTMDSLWGLFERALTYTKNQTEQNLHALSEIFDRAMEIKYNGNSKITMGLYWIAPETFLNLDNRNKWYIYESKKLPDALVNDLPVFDSKVSADAYFEITNKLHIYLESEKSNLHSFMELSFEAGRYSQQVNDAKKKEHQQAAQEEKGAGLADEDVRTIHYWLYAPGQGASMWDQFSRDGVMGIGWYDIGDLSRFTTREAIKAELQKIKPGQSCINDSLALWQFSSQMKPGDIVYAKRGLHQIIARGVVMSDYEYDPDYSEHYPNLRRVEWRQTEVLERKDKIVQKTLTDITDITDYVRELEDWFAEPDEGGTPGSELSNDPPYSAEQFLQDVYMDQSSYDTLVGLVRTEKNVILQGAPGVGKTYTAKRLAYSMMGVKDQERVMMVQFHQSYSYEDFIEGFRPASGGSGFEIKKGSFYHFCKKAADDLDNEYFFIIDEINRGNLSKIFGELFMLIENDKRGNALQLLYSDDKFSVPRNVYIIGMMNTADRSLALLDYALRRRFAFFEMKPAFESEGFRKYRAGLNSEKFDRLIACVESLNHAIAADESLGEGFCIGHSYFCNLSEASDAALRNIMDYKLSQLLREYWYDDRTKANDWISRLKDAIK